MRIALMTLFVVLVTVLFARLAGGQEPVKRAGPVVAELFTSQGCSSCPPAEALFRDLAKRDDMIIIEWHVDYWDTLVHGAAGSWEDPYSSRAHTERQRDYNQALRATRSVYTPQAVIGGVFETVGSRRGEVSRLVANAPDLMLDVSFKRGNGAYTLNINGPSNLADTTADIRLVHLLPRQTTKVKAGENKGRTLASSNIAVSSEILGSWAGGPLSLDIASMPENGQSCAVLVQARKRGGPGQILGAAYCPESRVAS